MGRYYHGYSGRRGGLPCRLKSREGETGALRDGTLIAELKQLSSEDMWSEGRGITLIWQMDGEDVMGLDSSRLNQAGWVLVPSLKLYASICPQNLAGEACVNHANVTRNTLAGEACVNHARMMHNNLAREAYVNHARVTRNADLCRRAVHESRQ